MSKEQKELLDEAWFNFSNSHYGKLFVTKEDFIDRIKDDTGLSQKWGLKIEERELSDAERLWLCSQKHNMRFSNVDGPTWYNPDNPDRNKLKWMTESQKSLCDYENIPTKLIKTTYNNETIESYE